MKLLINYLEYFISPITGKLVSHKILPSLTDDYVWEGNLVNEPEPSPVLIDMRLDTANLRMDTDKLIDDVDYILDSYLLNYLHEGKIWVGNEENRAVESAFTIDDFVKNEGDSFTTGDIAVWSDSEGQFIKDGGMSIPDLKVLAANAATSAAQAAASAIAASGSAALAFGYKESAEASASAAGGSASAALASAGAAAGSAGLAAGYMAEAATQAGNAYDSAVTANTRKIEAEAAASNAAASASQASTFATLALSYSDSALASKNTCQDILAQILSTRVILTGDVIGFGSIDSSIITTLDLTLDRIPLANADVSLNSKKITSLANGSAANDAVNFSQISGSGSICLLKANNLSDVASVSTSRTNLGLTNIAIQSVTQYDVLVGGASNAITSIGPGSIGQILRSGGASANPSYSSAIYPDTTSVNRILYSSDTNIISEITTANNSILQTNGSGVPSFSTTLPSGILATNLTLTTPILGTPQSGNLSNCSGYPAGSFTGIVSLSQGGTNASLTASNGGIFYSSSTAGAILSGTPTAYKLLVSGASAAPSWISRFFEDSSNLFIGTNCGVASPGGVQNVGLGPSCLNSLTSSASFNVGMGYAALFNVTTGELNVAIGDHAGDSLVTGNRCTLLGANSDVSVSNLTNATAIGYSATESESNSMTLGNSSLLKIKSSASVILGTNKIYLDAANTRIGVGITPTDVLHIEGSGTGLRVSDGTKAGRFFASASTNAIYVESITNHDLIFRTNAATRMKLDTAGNLSLGTGSSPGGGAVVMYISNAATIPTSDPVGGGILYVQSGALKYRGSSGSITILALA